MRCYLPWTQTFVNANGVAAPCCAPLDMGNLAERALPDVFMGKAYQDLRSDLAKERRSEATRYCDGCYSNRKTAEAGITFDHAYALGLSGEETHRILGELEATHPEFVRNYRIVRESYFAGTRLPPGAMPLRMEVQLGEHCDIRCIMCWQDHLKPRALKPENFEQIADMLPYAVSVLFTGGEPTVYKDFWKLVERFKETANPYAKFDILTHANRIKDNIEKFDGIRYLNLAVNVDGPTPSTYAHIRRGADWGKLNESLAAIQEARERNPHWQLNTTFLLMRSNIDLIEESMDFAEKYGAAWGCGMIAGEYTPINQCRTYLEENIFRFSHPGYSKDEIIARLEAALPRAHRHPHALAASQIMATIQQVRDTRQMQVTPEELQTLRSVNDPRDLSRRLQAMVVADLRDARPPVESLREQLSALQTSGVADGPSLANAGVALAEGLMEEERWAEAEHELLEALKTLSDVADGDAASDAVLRRRLGLAKVRQGRDEGFAEMDAAWRALTERLGARATLTAETALEYGQVLKGAKRFDEAVAPLRQASEAFAALHGKQTYSSYVAVSANDYGHACVEAGLHDEAEVTLKKAIKAFDAYWGPESQHTLNAIHLLSRSYIEQERFDEADALLNRAMDVCRTHLDSDDMSTQLTRFWLDRSLSVKTELEIARRPPRPLDPLRRIYHRGRNFMRGLAARVSRPAA